MTNERFNSTCRQWCQYVDKRGVCLSLFMNIFLHFASFGSSRRVNRIVDNSLVSGSARLSWRMRFVFPVTDRSATAWQRNGSSGVSIASRAKDGVCLRIMVEKTWIKRFSDEESIFTLFFLAFLFIFPALTFNSGFSYPRAPHSIICPSHFVVLSDVFFNIVTLRF